jgi:hypothetical protein
MSAYSKNRSLRETDTICMSFAKSLNGPGADLKLSLSTHEFFCSTDVQPLELPIRRSSYQTAGVLISDWRHLLQILDVVLICLLRWSENMTGDSTKCSSQCSRSRESNSRVAASRGCVLETFTNQFEAIRTVWRNDTDTVAIPDSNSHYFAESQNLFGGRGVLLRSGTFLRD